MVSGGKRNVSLSPLKGLSTKGCSSSFDLNLRNRIHHRQFYNDWGVKTIANELIQVEGYQAEQLPFFRTIESFLKSKNLTKNIKKMFLCLIPDHKK